MEYALNLPNGSTWSDPRTLAELAHLAEESESGGEICMQRSERSEWRKRHFLTRPRDARKRTRFSFLVEWLTVYGLLVLLRVRTMLTVSWDCRGGLG
jgi:hypothetical protein